MVTHLMSLSNELLSDIAQLLSGSDIKSVRLCSKRLHKIATPFLCLERLFLSPVRKNIDVFKAVASHPQLSRRVREIIWEDVVICHPWDDENFDTGCSESVLANSHAFYETLCAEHESIMKCAEDVATLRLGLSLLPNLKRITLAIEPYEGVDGLDEFPRLDLNCPLAFRTPLLRSVPVGVRLPQSMPKLRWNDNYPGEREYLEPWVKARNHFRELCIILEEMARSNHQVKEFVVQRFHFSRGISHRMFSSPCSDTQNATIAFRGLQRLDLALDVRWAEEQNWICFRSGVLREALAGANELKHLTLRTNLGWNCNVTYGDADVIRLLDILTPKSWPYLQKLELENWFIDASDLEAFLPQLPMTLNDLLLIVKFRDSPWEGAIERVVTPFAQTNTSLNIVAKQMHL